MGEFVAWARLQGKQTLQSKKKEPIFSLLRSSFLPRLCEKKEAGRNALNALFMACLRQFSEGGFVVSKNKTRETVLFTWALICLRLLLLLMRRGVVYYTRAAQKPSYKRREFLRGWEKNGCIL